MSGSSSSSSSAPKLDSVLANQPAPATTTAAAAAAPAQTNNPATSTTTTAASPTPAPTTQTPTTTTAVTEPTAAIVSPLREDMIKPAVSFLSSPNVRSADKAKKIAFLQQKGLNQAEIDEAFKRAGGDSGSTTATTAATTTSNNYTPSVQQQALAPVLPSRQNINYAAQPTTQIVYYPQPPNPPIPVEKVFAMAVILGMSAVGLTAGVIGLLKRFISPIFNRIAEYKHTRYNQRKVIADKLLKSLNSTENDDLDALIDQGEEKTVVDALVKHQSELSSKIDKLVQTSKERLLKNKTDTTYSNFRSELTSFRSVITNNTTGSDMHSSYSHYNKGMNHDSAAVSGLKSDIRSFKAVLLNRRNFPK